MCDCTVWVVNPKGCGHDVKKIISLQSFEAGFKEHFIDVLSEVAFVTPLVQKFCLFGSGIGF